MITRKKLKIDEVALEVHRVMCEISSRSGNSRMEGRLAIYMDYEYHQICLGEVVGDVSPAAYGYHYSGGTHIMGVPIFKVVTHHGVRSDKNHPPFRVLELES